MEAQGGILAFAILCDFHHYTSLILKVGVT